jgi:hypothetical protein
VIIVIGRQPTVAAMRINAHITRFWRDPGDHAGDKASAHIGGYRVPPTRRAITVGNEAPPAGLAALRTFLSGKRPGWPDNCGGP